LPVTAAPGAALAAGRWGRGAGRAGAQGRGGEAVGGGPSTEGDWGSREAAAPPVAASVLPRLPGSVLSDEHERYGFLPSWAATASFYWAYGPYCNISQTTHAVPLYILLYFSKKNTYYYIEILMFVTKIMVIPWNTRVCP